MSYSIDITESNFMQDIVEASKAQPVLVDFWATWCEPCKTLMPVLEKLSSEYNGQFRLAKVEIDQEQNIATQFAVRSVPTVKFVINGEIVDEFTGALPESDIRAFINKHITQAEDSPLQLAITLFQQGEVDKALEQMQTLMLAEPTNPDIRIEFANMLMREKRFDDARELLNSLSAEDKLLPTALALFSQLDSIQVLLDAPDFDELMISIEKDGNNLLARDQLSAHYKLRGEFEAAMEQLLEIVRRDRSYNDEIGRKELLKIFEILGPTHELVGIYRRKLAQTLN